MMTLLASAFAGLAMFFGGLFGGHMPPANMGSTTPSHMGSTTPMGHMGDRMPGVAGKITSISGTTFTMNGRVAGMGTGTTTYTVDASSAKIYKAGNGIMRGMKMSSSTPHMASSSPMMMSISDLAVGDNVLVTGTTTGTTIEARSVLYGFTGMMQTMMGAMGGRAGDHMGSTSMMMHSMPPSQ